MKKRYLMMTLLLTMTMVLASVSSVFATIDPADAYDYTIKVYAGEHGHFTKGNVSDNGKTITMTVKPGDVVTIDSSSTGLTIDNDEYYARGFRPAGHDNDELISTLPAVDEDGAYEVAYGIKGGMVKYTIMYVDGDGETLRDADEYYGMVGDKPVVSYKYVEGYQPNAYNLTKTLSADEAENVFAFSYLKNPAVAADNDTTTQAGAANAANGNNANAAGNANANANANAAANGNNNDNTPATIVDLDDNATPQAENAGDGAADIADTETPKAGLSPAVIGAGALLVAAIAAAAVAIAKRRRDDEYEDDEDEEDSESAGAGNSTQHAYSQQQQQQE